MCREFSILLLLAIFALRANSAGALPWDDQPLPENIRALNAAAAETGDPDRRIRRYASAFKACNTNHAAMYAIGIYMLATNNPEAAIQFLTPLAPVYSNEPAVFLPLAEAHVHLERPSKRQLQSLQRTLNRLARTHSADPAIAHALSRIAYRLGNYDDALAHAARAYQLATYTDPVTELLPIYAEQRRLAQQAVDTFTLIE